MKKVTFLFVALIATLFCACNNDDDKSNPLDGTTWVADEGTEEVLTLAFQKSIVLHTFVYDKNLDGVPEEKKETSGTYNVEGNNVILEFSEWKQSGVISGNKMNVKADGDILEYYKK